MYSVGNTGYCYKLTMTLGKDTVTLHFSAFNFLSFSVCCVVDVYFVRVLGLILVTFFFLINLFS